MKRTTELIAEPGDRVEVLFRNGWFPALLLWAETTWEPDGETTKYRVSLDPDDINGQASWHVEPEIRKPEQP